MRLGLILSEVGQGFRRNLSMVVSVILVTFISLTFFGAAVLLQLQIGQMKGYWYDRAEVTVYMCSAIVPTCDGADATEEQIDAVKAQLEGDTLADFVDAVNYETAEDAFARFQEEFEGTTVAELATIDSFGPDFQVRLVNPEESGVIIDSVSGMPGVDEVRDQRALLQPIFDVMNAASYTAVGIAALMLVAAVLLISTTIRLSAFSRRRELAIMRLVGASNRFIETPFILEGIVASFIGSLLASGAVIVIVHFFVQGYLTEMFTTYSFIGLQDALLVAPILIGVGALLAALSASVAIRRYLKA
ncbi:permease-like cell division protein FtsX [Homoserinibacter sp. GY 40078]|uniref:permease-like cell division protein FtsX n=1 Tax=Homoserinibacter sp. GY 40078 TaxID=2603275 RepID=UPI0011C7170D|nr:permease-like cell division protein FtsX [Homoserinibacter sp. GY 40078]TXK17182.1 ABC transporter permease [Homoserinibacter sp. GY 40078]